MQANTCRVWLPHLHHTLFRLPKYSLEQFLRCLDSFCWPSVFAAKSMKSFSSAPLCTEKLPYCWHYKQFTTSPSTFSDILLPHQVERQKCRHNLIATEHRLGTSYLPISDMCFGSKPSSFCGITLTLNESCFWPKVPFYLLTSSTFELRPISSVWTWGHP